MATSKNNRKSYIVGLLLIIGIPVVILFCGIILLKISEPHLLPKVQKVATVQRPNTDLTPNSIAESPINFQDKEVTVYGIVEYQNDRCENEKTIIIKEVNGGLVEKTSEMKVFFNSKTPICQKIAGSNCEYNCGNIEVGKEYEITGKVVLERPTGMTLSRGYLDYYLEVIKAHKVEKTEKATSQDNFIDRILKKFSAPLTQKEL